MKEIQGKAKTVRELLSGQRYSIDYYQREYKWKRKQVQELVDDLTVRFLDDYDEYDERDAVQNYGHYFLGSIILSTADGWRAHRADHHAWDGSVNSSQTPSGRVSSQPSPESATRRPSHYKLCAEGKIPGTKVGRHWRFRRETIDSWLDNKSVHPQSNVVKK